MPKFEFLVEVTKTIVDRYRVTVEAEDYNDAEEMAWDMTAREVQSKGKPHDQLQADDDITDVKPLEEE